MKIDKKTLDALGTLPDDKLWPLLRMVCSSAGLTLPVQMPSPEQMQNLRSAMSNVADSDLQRAAQLAAIYKGEKK